MSCPRNFKEFFFMDLKNIQELYESKSIIVYIDSKGDIMPFVRTYD